MRTPIELVEYALSDWEAAGKIERYEDLPERFRLGFCWWNDFSNIEFRIFKEQIFSHAKELKIYKKLVSWWLPAATNQSDFQRVAIQPRIEFLRGLLNKLKTEQNDTTTEG